jgi:predicted phage-related endonuclease
MPPRFIDVEQGSQGWLDARAGHASASRFGDILAGKGSREAYLFELVAERLAGPKRDSGGIAKTWGSDAEVIARREYSIRTGNMVRQVGFAIHSRIKWCGASTDGLVGDHEFIEVKSPFNSGIHARTLSKGMPDVHMPQVQGNAWVLERQRGIFISFDPAFSKPHDLYMQPIERDEKFIRYLEVEVKKFLAEVAIVTREIKHSNHNKD